MTATAQCFKCLKIKPKSELHILNDMPDLTYKCIEICLSPIEQRKHQKKLLKELFNTNHGIYGFLCQNFISPKSPPSTLLPL